MALGRGATYAREAGKSLVLINGVAAISVLTFIGNHPVKSFGIVRAIIMFFSGSLVGVVFFGTAFAAQLSYGNNRLGRCIRPAATALL
jgi:hypothetical protein